MIFVSGPSVTVISFGVSSFAAIPALPDTERRVAYSLSASIGPMAVTFAIYGDGADYQNWVQIWLNGIQVQYNDPTFGWTLTSPTGSLSTIPRPITDGSISFNNAQTGTVQIVGARRPRHLMQFSENQGVAARDFNQVLTDIIAENREFWDFAHERLMTAPAGEMLGPLPSAATRANFVLGFDGSGNPIATTIGSIGPPVVTASLPAPSLSNKGARATVTDANTTLTAGIGAVVVGGGTNTVPVFCDGTNWRIG
jgi:hypothetical protein